jgi:hypothetical protein
MTAKTKTAIFSLIAMFSFAAGSAQPFERYQTIIDRKPFGPEPVNFDPEAAPGSEAAARAAADAEMTEEQRTVEEQQLAASVRVSMINVTPSGAVAVGFTDTSANPAENYYLIVGRSQNGWTVKSVDPATETVELEKGGVAVKVKLGETSGGGNAKGAKALKAARPKTLQSRGGIPAHSPQPAEAAPASAEPASARLGGLARLRQRRAEMCAKAQEEAARKAEADAVAAAEREERAEREAEEKRQRAEREARDAEERAQQREALRQIQEQLRKEREAREAAERQTETVQEE